MKALVFDKALTLKDVPLPEREPGESLVRVILAGICNTDIEITKGYMSFSGIPGHEFVGRVEESDDSGLVGRRVVGEINAGCGKCRWCRRGLERHCPNRTVLGRHPERAPLLTGKGLRWARSGEDREGTFDIVVESSGSPAAWDLAVSLARPRGTIVLKSTVAAGRETNLSPLVVNEITVVGSRCGPFRPALKLLEKGLVDPSPLIDSRFDLADYAAAFDRARAHALKVLLGMPR